MEEAGLAYEARGRVFESPRAYSVTVGELKRTRGPGIGIEIDGFNRIFAGLAPRNDLQYPLWELSRSVVANPSAKWV